MAGLDRAHAVAERLLANVEQVVLGKTEQVRLVARRARLPRPRAVRGRARHGEDGARARARGLDRGRRPLARPVHAGPAADGRHRPLASSTSARASSSSGPGPSSRTSSSSTRSTARCRRRSRRCSRRWPSGRSPSTASRAACPSRSSCSRPRTRSSTRGRSRSRRRSSTASSCARRSATRAPRTSSRSSARSGASHPLEALEPAIELEELTLLQDAVPDVYADELVERWVVALVEATRSLPEVAVGASVRGTLALDRTARAWALLTAGTTSCRRTWSELFLPVLGHRLLLEPSFLVEAEELERDEALARVKRALPRARAAAGRRRADRRGRVLTVAASRRRTFPLVPRRRLVGVPFGEQRERAARRRLRRRGLAAVRARRPRLDDRLVRDGAAVGGARRRRVRRAHALRRRGAAGRARRRPAPGDGAVPAGAALAVEAGGASRRRRGVDHRERARGARRARLPRPRRRPAVLAPAGLAGRTRRRLRATRDVVRRARGLGRPLARLPPAPRAATSPPGHVRVRRLGLPACRRRRRLWLRALPARWDPVPVVVQDPTWERASRTSAASSCRCSTRRTGRVRDVRLRRSEARRAGARRTRSGSGGCSRGFARLGLDPVVLDGAAELEVAQAFLRWAERRRPARGGRAGEALAVVVRGAASCAPAAGAAPLVVRHVARPRHGPVRRRLRPRPSTVVADHGARRPGHGPDRGGRRAASAASGRRVGAGRRGSSCSGARGSPASPTRAAPATGCGRCGSRPCASRRAAPAGAVASSAALAAAPRRAARAAGRGGGRARAGGSTRRRLRPRRVAPGTLSRLLWLARRGASRSARSRSSRARCARVRPPARERADASSSARSPPCGPRPRPRRGRAASCRGRARRALLRARRGDRSTRGASAGLGRSPSPSRERVLDASPTRSSGRCAHEPRAPARGRAALRGAGATDRCSSVAAPRGCSPWPRSSPPRSLGASPDARARARFVPKGSSGIVVLDLSASISVGHVRADREHARRARGRRRPLRARRLLDDGLRGAAARHARRRSCGRSCATSRCRAQDQPGFLPEFPRNPWQDTFSPGRGSRRGSSSPAT